MVVEKTKGDVMSWLLFGQVVLLIVVFALVNTVVKCLHDAYCTKCKRR